MKQGWTQMPSGRWVTTAETKYGHLACHVWETGRWEVSRGGKCIGSGSVWSNDVAEAMRHAENWAANLIEHER